MIYRLRTESEGSTNLPSIITDEKIVGIRDTFSNSVFDVFTRRSFIRSQFIISELYSMSSKLKVGDLIGSLMIS